MKIKCIFKGFLKLAFLVIVMFMSLAVSSSIVGISSSSDAANTSILPILAYSFMNTVIIALFIANSRLNRIKLIAVTSLIFFSIQYFMTQIETLYFNSAINMPIKVIIKVIISGALNSIIFSTVAVIILGKFKKGLVVPIKNSSIPKPIAYMAILSIAYTFIYFIFGYFVAWQFSEIRVFYTGSSDILNMFNHLANVLRNDTWLPLFQIFRGFLWAAIGLIIINSLAVKKSMEYLISSLLFSVLISSPLLFSNQYMPGAIRFGHFIELFTSMVLFGALSIFVKDKLMSSEKSNLSA
ncbi:hypothetical protein [Clostridium peptidivorans]|uniref:hypothetical protein n=1 Tax=Clostridium peptidivorans TaxID=100174 RepID=UPI000BE3183F|nr:hypothetical protein [Clostridium peptidivorans]